MNADEEKQQNVAGPSQQNVTPTTPAPVVVDPQTQKAPGQVIGARIVYYIGGFIAALLAVRFILALFGANRENAFADFIFGLSGVFVEPFFGLFNYEPSYGRSELELSTLVAIVIYSLLAVGIAKLFTLNRRDPDAV